MEYTHSLYAYMECLQISIVLSHKRRLKKLTKHYLKELMKLEFNNRRLTTVGKHPYITNGLKKRV